MSTILIIFFFSPSIFILFSFISVNNLFFLDLFLFFISIVLLSIYKNQKPRKAVSKTKQSNQIKKVVKKQSHQQVNTINKALQQGKINQKNKPQKLVKNNTNLIPKQEYSNNSQHTINQNKVTSKRIIQRIQKSMDYDKNKLYNDPVNKTYKVEKPKYTEISQKNEKSISKNKNKERSRTKSIKH